MSKAILHYLQDHLDDMIETLKCLVSLESPSGDKQTSDIIIKQLGEWFNELTDEVIVIPQETIGDMLKVNFGKGDRQILILAHADTVWPLGETSLRPFSVKDRCAYGPGVSDMKGGLTLGIWALRALHHFNRFPDCRIVFLVTTDEETGSIFSKNTIEAEARKSDYVLVLEPAAPGGKLKTQRKGVFGFEMIVHGITAHAANANSSSINAIEELSHQILNLQRLSNPDQGTTVNVNHCIGGSYIASIPDRAVCRFDLRFDSEKQGLMLKEKILSIEPILKGAAVEISLRYARPMLKRTEENLAAVEIACRLANEIGFELEEASVGGGSDGSFTSAMGVPTLDGLGSVGSVGHIKGEFVELDLMAPKATLVARLLETL